jgi:hypothetical protein
VGAILRDLSTAQDTASRHTGRLAIEYERDPMLRHFPVPRTHLEDIELELRFAPKRVQHSVGDRDRAVARAVSSFERYAGAASDRLVAAAASLFSRARSISGFPQSLVPEIHRNLESSEFTTYLAKAIDDDLFAKRDDLLRLPADLDIDGVSQSTIATAAHVVLEHPDLKRFVESNQPFTTEALKALGEALQGPLDDLKRDYATPTLLESECELEVITNISELRDLPPHAFSTLRIKARMDGYRWVVTEAGAPDELVAEG